MGEAGASDAATGRGPDQSSPSPDKRAQASAAIKAIWDVHRGDVLDRVTVVEEAVTALLFGGLDDELRAAAAREAHKLAGAAGTFGFARGSELARELEDALAGAARPGLDQVPRLADVVLALRAELEATPHQPSVGPAGSAPRDDCYVLVVEDDVALGERLRADGAAHGLQVELVDRPAAAAPLIAVERPAVVLLDLNFPDGRDGALGLLEDLTNGPTPVPVFVFSVDDAFVDRVEVARRGAWGFLSKSLPLAQVFDAVTDVLRRSQVRKSTVLAVDDDPVMLAVLQHTLTDHGFDVVTLASAVQFWESLDLCGPDLVILDADMPDVSGIELCQVLRNDPRWASLPVLFLTGRTDREQVTQMFQAGADDYVAKPIVPAELLARITNRLERIQIHQALADIDPLTGAATRRRAEEAFDTLLRLANRFGEPVSLAVLDIDHFKRVNDQHGHATGDEVLRRMGTLLTGRFRGEDVVARWGGEEFLVAMYGLTKDDGVERLAQVLEIVRDERFAGRDACSFSVTFSAGVAQYPADGGDLPSLYRAADEAMYRAKDAGRDRVRPVGWFPDGETELVDVVLVEDDEVVAGLLTHALETRGHRIAHIPDGTLAAQRLVGPDAELRARVVLLDVDLPGLSGVGVLRQMAAEGVLDTTKVIMLTARATEKEILATLELGAIDHVAKPFSIPVLLERVRLALCPTTSR